MGAYALTGADTFIINDRPLNDFTDNTIINIDIPNDDIGTSTGKMIIQLFLTVEKAEMPLSLLEF